MNIAFLTDMNFTGKIPANFENMRTEFAWMHALDATHYPLSKWSELPTDLNIVVVILPKTLSHIPSDFSIEKVKLQYPGTKIGIHQEGPSWYYQDYDIQEQYRYLCDMLDSDFILAHNANDKYYYQGLLRKDNVYVNKTLMITPPAELASRNINANGVIIGGNFCGWYNGLDSYLIAKEFQEPIFAPRMGRMKDDELVYDENGEITHLPYMKWDEWINNLSNYKYGVHLIRRQLAGTFALNCAYWGIPCVGYQQLDTQRECHPYTSVQTGDLFAARMLAQKLRDDKEFYELCSATAIDNYNKYYGVDVYKERMKEVLEGIKNDKRWHYRMRPPVKKIT